MSGQEEMTVRVATTENEIMTITMTPTRVASSNATNSTMPNSATMSSDQEGVIATSALQMVDDVDIIDDHSYRTTSVAVNPEEPVAKRQRLATNTDAEDGLKSMLLAVNRSLCARLDAMEGKMKQLQNFCQDLDGKVKKINAKLDGMSKNKSTPTKSPYTSRKPKATLVGLPPPAVDDGEGTSEVPLLIDKKDTLDATALGSNVTLITLNSEEDFPHGSWLGDANNIQCRVRCGVTPTDMLHVMETSRTADKCALKLMDYLFDRETQATSNLSGSGKHSKRQLDPLMIYGIRCHLVHKFGITDDDWHRIKLNIDSKCRTAFRRKQKGLPLKVKAFSCSKPLRPGESIRIKEDPGGSILTTQSDETGAIQIKEDPGGSILTTQSDETGAIQVEYKLHELPDGQVAAVPAIPVAMSAADSAGQNRVQLSGGQQIAISESAHLQIAQMCSQGIPPGATFVMTQSDVQEDNPDGSNIVMRLSADGTCLEQVRETSDGSEFQQQQEGADSQEKAEVQGAGTTSEDHSAHDNILVEIQTLGSSGTQSPKNT